MQWPTWTLGGCVEEWCKAAFWTQETPPRLPDVERFVIPHPCLRLVAYLLTCIFAGNVPFFHTSTQWSGTSLHVTQIYQAFSTLVLQVTNTGVRRPGHKTKHKTVPYTTALRIFLPAGRAQRLYVFCICWSVNLCVPTYHVCNNYVKYIVAMRLYFSRLRQFGQLLCVTAMSSLAPLWLRNRCWEAEAM